MAYMVPWEGKIKSIESHFGSVVSSYFIFLRWVISVNLIMALVIFLFVMLPEILSGDTEDAGVRKEMLSIERRTASNFKILWDFEGVMRYSPLFYGFYSNKSATAGGYETPLAYFVVMMLVYVFSFIIILRKMAENSRQSKLTDKGDECTFTWRVFTSWDYGIANPEAAHNKVAAIVTGIRESIIELTEKERIQLKNWKDIGKRVAANILVLLSLVGSASCVLLVVDRSTQPEADSSWWRQNETTIVMSLITSLVPKLFDLFSILENYHPRKAMRWMLARIMALNLLSLYALIFALFGKTNDMIRQLNSFEMMNDSSLVNGKQVVLAPADDRDCFFIPIPCSLLQGFLEPEDTISLQYRISRENTTLDTPLDPSQPSTQSYPDFNIEIKDLSSEDGLRKDMELNARAVLSELIRNISKEMINREKAARLLMVWREVQSGGKLRVQDTANITGDCTRDECIIYCEPSCLSLCEIFFSCGGEDSLQDLEIQTIRDLSQALGIVSSLQNLTLNSLNEEEVKFFVCLDCLSFKLLTNNVTQNYSLLDYYSNVTAEQINLLENSSTKLDFKLLEEKTCSKQICRKRYVRKEVDIEYTQPRRDCETTKEEFIKKIKTKLKLRKLCWETMFGQELVKLTVMDTVFLVVSIFIGDFLRSIFLRIMNLCWFWDLEKVFPGYPQFDVAENILHLVNNQGMIWMGLFMAPGLPLINLVKLFIIMYVKSMSVMVTNAPHETVFKASRSNNFYLVLLLLMLFLCTLPVAFTLVWIKPSWHCGPFSQFHRIYKVFTVRVLEILPVKLHPVLDYITSPGIIIPTLVLCILTIWYLITLSKMLRESNDDLKNQLHLERTEERRKLTAAVNKKGKESVNSEQGGVSERWKSILSAAVSRSTSQTEKSEPGDTEIIKAGILSSDQNLDKVGKQPEPRDSDELAPKDSKPIPVNHYNENSPKLVKKGILGLYARIKKKTGSTNHQVHDISRTQDQQDQVTRAIHEKILKLERPSIFSVYENDIQDSLNNSTTPRISPTEDGANAGSLINNFGDLDPDSSVFVLNHQVSDISDISDILTPREDGETIQGGSFIGEEETGRVDIEDQGTGKITSEDQETGRSGYEDQATERNSSGDQEEGEKRSLEPTDENEETGRHESMDKDGSKIENIEKDHINLPKIWISKSASMEHDLD